MQKASMALWKLDRTQVMERFHAIWKSSATPDGVRVAYLPVMAFSAPVKPSAYLLLRSSWGLRPGKFKTWYINQAWLKRPKEGNGLGQETKSATFDIPGLGRVEFEAKLQLQPNAVGDNGEPGPDAFQSVQWSLKLGDGEWIPFPEMGDPWMDPQWASADETLLWIGDLDLDGKPDVLLSPILGPFIGGRYYQLFLSRIRIPGKVWSPSAEFYHFPSGSGD